MRARKVAYRASARFRGERNGARCMKAMTNSPLAQAELADVLFVNGCVALKHDLARGLSLTEVLQGADLTELTEKGSAAPSLLQMRKYISYTHSAVFAEVRVDEDLGVVRIPKIVCAAAAGRIINPRTARSQILGGVVMGIGMALHEEAMTDHRLGKIMNHNFAEYHVPAHADIDVIFVDETDDKVDFKIRSGKYPAVKDDRLPYTLGRDFSGIVEKCGAQAARFKVGDEAFGIVNIYGGGYSEKVAVDERAIALKPAIDHTHAAAIPLAGQTAWQGLFRHGQLKAGQTVLIHGGSGPLRHSVRQSEGRSGADDGVDRQC